MLSATLAGVFLNSILGSGRLSNYLTVVEFMTESRFTDHAAYRADLIANAGCGNDIVSALIFANGTNARLPSVSYSLARVAAATVHIGIMLFIGAEPLFRTGMIIGIDLTVTVCTNITL